MHKRQGRRKVRRGLDIGAMCLLSLGIIAVANMAKLPGIPSITGKDVDISGLPSEDYQVSRLQTLEDGSYIVYGSSKGFAGEIETAVTFDAAGENILSLVIISQNETQGLGTKITEEGFLSTFNQIAGPIQVGDLEVASPVTGGVGGNSSFAGLAVKEYGSSKWDADDLSPEAETMRSLYHAGLLTSSKDGKSLSLAVVDLSPEEQTHIKLSKAGLLQSSKEGKKLSTPVADHSPEAKTQLKLAKAGLLQSSREDGSLGVILSDLTSEERAVLKLEQAGLLETELVAAGEPVDVTKVDGISGATVSSKAVAKTINNGYFFIKEQIKNMQ